MSRLPARHAFLPAPTAAPGRNLGRSAIPTPKTLSSTRASLAAYHAAVLVACAEALDSGVFYQDDFTKFVRERCDALDPAVEKFLGDHEISMSIEDRPARAHLVRHVTHSPRGAWATIHSAPSPDSKYWRPIISDGSGNSPVGGSFDAYGAPAAYAKAYSRMVSYEIYLARKAVEAERLTVANKSALERAQIQVGATYRNIQLNGKTYSTAVVTGVDETDAQVQLYLTRRGSPNRWTAKVGATRLASQIESSSAS